MKVITLYTLLILTGCHSNEHGKHLIPDQLGCRESETYRDIRLVGGPCEGCEAIFEFGNRSLEPSDTLPDFNGRGYKLKLSGTIYTHGTEESACNVIMYIYHTNQEGIYPTHDNEIGWAKRHGYIRGWVKTDSSGKYTFYTLIPGAYPNRNNPKHIHVIILEPDGKYYYIEDFLFHGDPKLTDDRINRPNPRGGDGFVVTATEQNGLLEAHRNIELGKNVPGYDK